MLQSDMAIQRLQSASRSASDAPGDPSGVRLRTLVHELSSLIDGSLRYTKMAERALKQPDAHPVCIDNALRCVHAASRALDHATALLQSTKKASVPTNPLDHLGSELWREVNTTPAATLGEAVQHALELLGPVAQEHHATMQAGISPEACSLPAMSLFPLIVNALRNSLEATGKGGLIEVRARVISCCLHLEVLDDGPGPSPQALRRAFETGFTTKPSGTGIGLSVAAAVVQEHKGRISLAVRTDLQGRGAVLAAVIPLHTESINVPSLWLNDWGE